MAAAGTSINETIRVRNVGRDAAAARIVDLVGRRDGYELTAITPEHLELSRTYRESWATPAAIVIGVVTLGLGLLLARRHTEACSILLVEDEDGVSLHLEGRLSTEMLHVLRDGVGGAAIQAGPLADDVHLVFDDGRIVAVARGGVIGRNPIDDPDLPGGLLITLDEASISKTHLSFRPGPKGIMVRDRASTAGSVVLNGKGSTPCPPNVWTHVPTGSVMKVGDVSIRVIASRREGAQE